MHFLQSPAWEAFQHALGRPIHHVSGVLVIEHSTPLGSYWYAGRPELTATSFDELVQQAKSQQLLFVRVDPVVELPTTSYQLRATSSTQPQTTLVRRIDLPDDALLTSFKEKTRYNIRLATKKGVTVRATTDPVEVELFTRLAEGTGARQDFRYHGADYYQAMLAQAEQTDGLAVQLLLAQHEGQPVAALILLIWEKTAYYLHGASNHAARAVMAPHLLQFEAMRLAREAGASSYDFWGVAPPILKIEDRPARNVAYSAAGGSQELEEYTYDQNHPWAGVTRFKLGFGGEVVQSPDSFDVVLNAPKYSFYKTLRGIRRWFA